MPWLKLAKFGRRRSERNCLRHNANVEYITGIELDYDDKQLGFEEAGDIADRAEIGALFYTSASHTPAAPKWRMLVPTFEPQRPELRAQLVARINGLYGGIFAPELFMLSQAYYFGGVIGRPAHEIMVVGGDYIDQRRDLDAGALGKDHKRPVLAARGRSTRT